MTYHSIETERYDPPNPFDLAALKHALRQRFPRIEVSHDIMPLTLYDTFDWRLLAKGRLLVRDGAASFKLLDARTDQVLATEATRLKRPARHWWEWPASPLREYLRDVLDVRALIPWITLETQITTLSLRNSEEKAVVRLAVESTPAQDSCNARAPLQVGKLVAVRGYREEWQAAEALLTAAGFTAGAEPLPITALRQRGQTPGGYAPKADIPLSPDMPAGAAGATILAHLLGVMRQNEDGLRRDVDTEFLHDFRVAVRRARSLLTLLKGVFAPDVHRSLESDLLAAGKASNQLRDLDVYLLQQRDYEDLLPDPLRPGIRPLFATLKRRRRQARQRMLNFLDSADYRRLVGQSGGLARGLATPAAAPERARQTIGPLASRVIAKCHRKIIKAGGRIDAAAPDAELHRLRIACKKLRYALEFFTTLYPPDEMKQLIKLLKALQDNLGRFNDLSVQQAFLHAYLRGIDGRKPRAVEMAAATGALIGRLHQEHRQVRQAFEAVFGGYRAPDNRQRYAQLFSPPESAS